MKFNKPIKISFLDFFKEGKFDFLTLGKSKEWVYHNFSSPDNSDELLELEKDDIWFYGNIELHFLNGLLWLIYSDHIRTLDGGLSLDLDKWFLEKSNRINLLKVIEYLNAEDINFTKERKESDPRSIDLKLLGSGVELLFMAIDDERFIDLDQNKYTLVAFSKCDK